MSDKFNDLLLKIQNDYADKETRESAVEEHYRETGIPLYDDIEDFAENLARDLNDDLVEKSYPKVGLLTAYKDIKVSNNINALPYVENLFAELEKYRTFVQTGYIQQMIDNILEKVAHTIYKLTNLQ